MKKRFSIIIQDAMKFRNVAILLEVCLVAVYIFISLSQESNRFIRYLFRLDGEFNIPALFSAAQLFLVGYGFLLLKDKLRQSASYSPTIYKALGIIFIYLSFDEAFFLHESISLLFRNVDWVPKSETGHGVWVLPYIILGLVFFLFNTRTFIKLFRQNTREFSVMAAGFFLYVLGGVGLETNKGLFRQLAISPEYQGILQLSSEEFLEMFGITIVLYGMLLLHQAVKNNPSLDNSGGQGPESL